MTQEILHHHGSIQSQSIFVRDLDPYSTPVAPHPDGLAPNFNSVGMKVIMRGVGYPFVLLSLAFLIMRLCARSNLKTHHTTRPLDNYLCIVAWIFTAGNTATILAQVGAYKHAWDMPIIDLKPSYFRRMVASCMLYGPSMFFAKASIFVMYIRVFGSVPWVRHTSYAALVLSGIGYWSVVPTCAICYLPNLHNSFAKGWDVDLERKTREGMVIPGLVIGACNLATDVIALAIPIPVILGLHMDWKKKVGYCAIFLTGAMGIVVSVLGLVYRINLIGPKRGDGTWWQAAVNLTTIVELCLSIIISCAPFAVGYWRRVFRNGSLLSSVRSVCRLRRWDRSHSPPPVDMPTVRSSRMSSATWSERELEVFRAGCRASWCLERDSRSFDTSVELADAVAPGETSQGHLPYHTIRSDVRH